MIGYMNGCGGRRIALKFIPKGSVRVDRWLKPAVVVE